MLKTSTFDSLMMDVRFGLRMLRARPGFTVVAVLALALGIGANTAIFSMIDAILVRELPVEEPQELVILRWEGQWSRLIRSISGSVTRDDAGLSTSTSFAYLVFERFRDENKVLSDTFAVAELYRLNLGVDGNAELVTGQLVSGEYFEGLRLHPQIGRLIGPEDDRANAEPVAVITDGYWKRKFGGDPAVLGKAIQVNANPLTIVGVTPVGFEGTLQVNSSPTIFVPLALHPRVTRRDDRFSNIQFWWIQIMGRLKPGMTVQQAELQLGLIMNQIATSFYEENPPGEDDEDRSNIPAIKLDSASRGMNESRARMTDPLFIALAISGIILLIACANVANLLLARSSVRQREIAVRLALGADRFRLVRQLLTESTLLSLSGGLLGVLFAHWAGNALLALLPMRFGRMAAIDLRLDLTVLAFTLGLALLTGILFGLAPALRTSGVNMVPALKESNSTSRNGGKVRLGLNRSLLVAQVAMSLTLLIVAGLFVQTLRNLEKIELGFNPDNILLFRVDPTLNGYEGQRLADLYREVRRGIEAIPGVESATLSGNSLLRGSGWWSSVSVQGYTPEEDERNSHYIHNAETNFLQTMQIPLLLGRDLEPRDNESAPKVAVVNESFAKHYFKGENPIGRRFGFGKEENSGDIEIVGVTSDFQNTSLRDEPDPLIILPYAQVMRQLDSMTFSVRTNQDPASIVPAARQAVQRVDGNVPLFEVKSLKRQIEDSILQERQFAYLAGLFGLLALALTCIGLYGILSYAVVQRTREIGIRMALGARGNDVVRLIMREMFLILIGAGIGLAAAMAGTRWIQSMLFGLTPADPAILLLATLIMILVAAASTYLPARRASQVDPLVALRNE